jgi:hypothetical protein
MAKTVDYVPVAAAGGANVPTQAAYVGSGFQQTGAANGLADPQPPNKAWRQATMVAAAVANFISNTLNIDVLDDGNLANLITNLTAALRNSNSSILPVAYAAAVTFDGSLSNKFEITLNGDTTLTLVNLVPGQELTIVVHQDGVGGHAFNVPGTLPMDSISGNVNITNMQKFEVLSNGTLFPASGMISQ